MRLPLPPPFAGDAADGGKQGAAITVGLRVNAAGCSEARKRNISARDSPHSQHSLQPLQLPAWLQELLQQQERLLARIQGDPLSSYSMAAASSSSPCPSSSSHSDAGPLGTAARRHLPFAKMLQTPRFSNPFAALPIPGGSSSESSAASADSAASPASASASPPSASASSAFQGDAASPSAASPSAAAPYSAPSAAGSKALILLPRQRLLLVPAADSTLATPADVITVVDAGSRKDPSVELIPGPAGDAGPSAVIPGPRVVTWSKLAGWRVELPPNLPDLTKLRPDIEKLRPALEARVQHTLSHVPFRELLEEIQQWSKARGGIGGWAEGSARGARRYPNKQKLSSVQDFFQYAEAEGTSLVHGSPELDKGGDGQVQLEPSPPLPPPQPPNPTVTSGGCTRGSVKRTGGESMQQQRATANVGSKGTEVSRTWGTHVRRAKPRFRALTDLGGLPRGTGGESPDLEE